MEEAVSAFLEAGLLRANTRADDKDDSVEIINDSLIYRWHRLMEWAVDERRTSERRLELLATARLWEKAGRLNGYLLTDKSSLNEAREYADPKIRDLVAASDRFLWRSYAWQIVFVITAAVTVGALVSALVVVGGLLFWHSNLENLINSEVSRIKELSLNPEGSKQILADQLRSFGRIQFYQRFLSSEVDLSEANLHDLNLAGTTLHDSRWIKAGLSNVNFGINTENKKADLKHAAFHKAHV
jgi:hypothetical protein